MDVITGAAGLVGGNLARALISQGRYVRGLIHKDRRAIEGLDIEMVAGDVRDLASLKGAFQGSKIVYHLAASISLNAQSGPMMQAINVIGTRNVVTACLECGVQRLIHLSSIHAIEQKPFSTPVTEDRPLAISSQVSPYDLSKALSEIEIQRGIKQGLDAIIINPSAIIGPYDFKPSHMGKAIISLASEKLPILVKGGFDWVDVRDVVSGMISAEQSAPSGSKYILSGHWRSVRQVADHVSKLTNSTIPKITVPAGLAYLGIPLINLLSNINGHEPLYTRFSLGALNSNRHISHIRATDELGYAARPFVDTIAETVEWFAKNEYLSPPQNL